MKLIINVFIVLLVIFLLIGGMSGCKLHAYGDSKGGDSETTTVSADDGSVVNDNDVTAGGDVSADDGSSVAQGGSVEASERDSDDGEFGEATDLEECEDTFLWKPQGEDTGELVILFNEVCPDFIEACVFNALDGGEKDGEEECVGVHSKDPVTGRLKFQFSEEGSEYSGDIVATDDEGDTFSFSVLNPAVRNDF